VEWLVSVRSPRGAGRRRRRRRRRKDRLLTMALVAAA
jgi:hypothetical protein